ncbi:MAG: hypothetical protein H6751_02485 [Candidatus Omnitrophica bacterium]|nr:hypothetical protein [Candidatus Omnitrophota bacterium]
MASTTGDEVWIRSATYIENVIVEKPLTLLGGFSGIEGPGERDLRNPNRNLTMIDGDRNNISVVTIRSTTVTLNRIVIQNGLSNVGSGLRIIESSVILLESQIRKNGIVDNAYIAGGIRVENSQCRITGCVINHNSASGGGGISSIGSKINLTHSVFSDNVANLGGAIAIGPRDSFEIDSCSFTRNTARYKYPQSGYIGFGGQGGAFYANTTGGKSNVKVLNSKFTTNTLTDVGSGSVFYGTGQFSAEFDQCTCIVGSHTTGFSLGGDFPAPVLKNCIVVSEPNGSSTPIWMDDAIVSHSLVEGGYPGEGNIDADPKFVDISGGDYHLQRGSPCIDSGTDTGVMVDFDGNPRPVGDYDMGAYEFPYLRSDLNGDGAVGPDDLLIFQQDWGKVSGD